MMVPSGCYDSDGPTRGRVWDECTIRLHSNRDLKFVSGATECRGAIEMRTVREVRLIHTRSNHFLEIDCEDLVEVDRARYEMMTTGGVIRRDDQRTPTTETYRIESTSRYLINHLHQELQGQWQYTNFPQPRQCRRYRHWNVEAAQHGWARRFRSMLTR